MKKKKGLEARSLLLGVSSILSFLIAGYLFFQYFQTIIVYTQSFSPWIILFFVPLFFALLNTFLAYMDNRKITRVRQFLDWISTHRSLVSIILLAVFIFIIYTMRLFLDVNEPLINLGMNGIGLLFFSHVLLLLIYLFFNF